jgi:hypothetical protein
VALMDSSYHASHLPALMRATAPITVHRLCLELDTVQERRRAAYPVLDLFFERLDSLKHVHLVRHLLAFSTLVTERMNLQLERTSSMTISRFIDMQSDKKHVQECFSRFQHAWNTVRASITRFQCRELPPIALAITPYSPLRWCCLGQYGESIMLLALHRWMHSQF